MTTPAVSQALRVPGTLTLGPFTDVTAAAAANGGTLLGLAQDVTLRWEELSRANLTAWEFGGETVDGVRGGLDVLLAWRIRGSDNDAVSTLFANTFAGGSGARGIREGSLSAKRAGNWESDDAVQLLFVPDVATSPAVLFYEAIPRIAQVEQGEVETAFGAEPEYTWLVSFLATRDSSGRRFEIAPRADLTAP